MTGRQLVQRWVVRAWAPHPWVLSGIVGLSFVNAILVTAFPWLWQYVVDSVRDSGDPVRLEELALWMLGIGVASSMVYLVLQGLRSVMNARIQWRAREIVFDHLSELGPGFYRRWRAGDLVTRLTDDGGEKISWFLCSGIFRTLEASLVIAACLAAMIWIDPVLAAWVVIPLPLLVVLQAFVQGEMGRRYDAVQESISGINDELTTTFSGIRIVQACGLREPVRRRFAQRTEEQRGREVRASAMQQLMILMYGYGWQAAAFALLLAGGMHVMDGTITLGEFVAFEGFVTTLVWPMFDLGMFVSRYKQAQVSFERLEALLDEPPPFVGGDAALTGAGVAMANASVVADDGEELLADVDLELRPGELLAVVGEVGSGKSTLMQLLAGARRATDGSVRVGGQSRDALDHAAVRDAVGYVPQDPVLLSATLRDNLLLGREFSDEAVERALDVSRFAQDLPALPRGLDTEVGERGVTLSGGQQQRLALARALVGEPAILLLDDATAALDADTEAAFWRRLEDLLPDVTAAVVTHRPATIQRADRVLVLQGGRIVQTGTHEELLGTSGSYQRIYGQAQAAGVVAGSG